MRWPFAAFVVLLLPSAALAQQTFPYKAFITADEVYVRSGPGENYYPTEKLKAGQEVEVYRHDPGGWYAIRPPRDSFSWVAGRYLQIGADGLATVNEDRVAARVGSRMSDVRDVIQVRLQKGETVELVDGRRATATAGNWYKIAPPSGEFRWVHSKYVDPNYSRDGIRRTSGSAAAASGGGSYGPDPYAGRHLTPSQFDNELKQIDIELATIVAEAPSIWDFSEIKRRTQSLFNQADNGVQRGRARNVLGKITRFEDIKQRDGRLEVARQEMARTARRDPRPGPNLLPPADPDGRYDAMGKLVRVEATKVGAPQYAVADEDGVIRCYVSPAPGVNLRYYLGQQVGINGVRGYMPEQRAGHVMARHVTVVNDSLVR